MRYHKDYQSNAQGIEYLAGVNAEAIAVGEVLTLASGLLTKAGVDSTGTQNYVALGAFTGDGVTKEIPVLKLSENNQFKTVSSATVAITLIGSAVTLNADAIRVTATTTNGVFVIDETDGATTISTVVGHFVSAGAL